MADEDVKPVVLTRFYPMPPLNEPQPCIGCGYDAEHKITLGSKFQRLFCNRCLMNALLDAINFAENRIAAPTD
jgi:hypothetical protein